MILQRQNNIVQKIINIIFLIALLTLILSLKVHVYGDETSTSGEGITIGDTTLEPDDIDPMASSGFQPIAPFSGNINFDIAISPLNQNIVSGEDAIYNLTVKTTGSMSSYDNVDITIQLPDKSLAILNPDFTTLTIDGVLPTYDEPNNQLQYHFDVLSAGATYFIPIKLTPPNGITEPDTALTASVSAIGDGIPDGISSTATVYVDASGSLSINKVFIINDPAIPTKPGDTVSWKIAVEINNKSTGLLYVKESTKISVVDTLPPYLTYISDDAGGNYDNTTKTISWQFDSPTITQQQTGSTAFFKTITVQTKVDDAIPNYTKVVNTATTTSELVHGSTLSTNAQASVVVADGSISTPDGPSSVWVPVHYPPAPAPSLESTTSDTNFEGTYYDWHLLKFNVTITPGLSNVNKDFQSYILDYQIDPNLVLQKIYVPADNFTINRGPDDPLYGAPPTYSPKASLWLHINGTWVKKVDDCRNTSQQIYGYFTRFSLGLLETDIVDMFRIDYHNAPMGFYPDRQLESTYTVKKGFLGDATNQVHIYGVNGDGDNFDYGELSNHSSLLGPRTVHIIPVPDTAIPIATTSVDLETHRNNIVSPGYNRIYVRYKNNNNSMIPVNGLMSAMVLLPLGVTANEPNPNVNMKDGLDYWDNQTALAASGSIIVVDHNYKGTGQQLLKVVWNDQALLPGKEVRGDMNIIISDSAPRFLDFKVFGFSRSDPIHVPSTSTRVITDSILTNDSNDMNSNGNTAEPCIISGNRYSQISENNVANELFIKGALDSDYGSIAHTTPGGEIDYLININNTTGKDITSFVLYEVLPSVGDLGITDNVQRGSLFTPILTGPISIPSSWANKVDILYSTAINPKRDDLVENVVYPPNAVMVTNPPDATAPNWMNAFAITDWSQIHSFKVSLKSGETMSLTDNIFLYFSMKAPLKNDITNPNVLDTTLPDAQRAAWNSFAIAIDTLQAVEPARTGIVINLSEPAIHKDVQGVQQLDLPDNKDPFTWRVVTSFGNDTSNWTTATIQDALEDILEIEEITVTDENGIDVTSNGILSTTNNFVAFDINKQNGNFSFLANHTYILSITTKIKSTATDAQITDYITRGGLPNQATFLFGNNDESIESEQPVVLPKTSEPTPGPEPKGSSIEAEKRSDPPSGSQVKAGDIITYYIDIKNTGDMVAENIVVEDLLPLGMQYAKGLQYDTPLGISVTEPGDHNDQTISFLIPQLQPSDSTTIAFNVIAPPSENSNEALFFNNDATVKYDHGQQKTNNVQHLVIDTDLIFYKTSDPINGRIVHPKTNATSGTTISYSINIQNKGQAAAHNIVVADKIPAGVTYVNNSAKIQINSIDKDIPVQLDNNTLTWDIPLLDKNDVAICFFQATVNTLPENITEDVITNVATVNAEKTNEVKHLIQLFNKKPSISSVAPGGEIDYSFTGIGNFDTLPLKDYTITDVPPSALVWKKVSLPAFVGNNKNTYTIQYTTSANDTLWHTAVSSVDASKPFQFEAPTLTGTEFFTKISIVFDNEIPVGFGIGNDVVFHFMVRNPISTPTITNQGFAGGETKEVTLPVDYKESKPSPSPTSDSSNNTTQNKILAPSVSSTRTPKDLITAEIKPDVDLHLTTDSHLPPLDSTTSAPNDFVSSKNYETDTNENPNGVMNPTTMTTDPLNSKKINPKTSESSKDVIVQLMLVFGILYGLTTFIGRLNIYKK